MITTPEIICDIFSFLDKEQVERIQLVDQFWNNVIIRHKNILPLRQFPSLGFISNQIDLFTTEKDLSKYVASYIIKFDGTNLSKIEEDESPRYSQLTVDEVLNNLNDVVFDSIQINECDSEDLLNNLLNFLKLVTTKTGGRFRGRYGKSFEGRFGSKLVEIFDNYIIVDELVLDHEFDSYIREVCANPEIVQLPSTLKGIRLRRLDFKENEKVLNFTCNGKLNGANRLAIDFETSKANYGNFIRQWFEVYRTHENPISLVGRFEIGSCGFLLDSVLDAIKTFLNNTQLRVKYNFGTKEFHIPLYGVLWCTSQYFIRRCVLHETDSYALVIEMAYDMETDMSSINASDLDEPPCKKIEIISFCVKSL